jgi:peptidoglycan/LPS O-acetylase OafA/YrhL
MFYMLGATLRDAPRRRFVQLTALAVMSWILATASNKGCYLPQEGWCGLPGLKGQFAPMMAIGAYGDYRLFVVSAISGALAIIGAGVAATKSPVGRAAIWAGRNSLNIYLLNGMVLAIANPILKTVPLGSDSSAAVLAVAIASVLAHGAIAHALGNPLSAFKSRAFQLADRFLENKRARQSLA